MPDEDDGAPYAGPFVVIAPDPLGYRVSIDPPPPGDDPARTFPTKDAAWRYASDWWCELHCPLRDLTDHNVRFFSGRATSNFDDDSV